MVLSRFLTCQRMRPRESLKPNEEQGLCAANVIATCPNGITLCEVKPLLVGCYAPADCKLSMLASRHFANSRRSICVRRTHGRATCCHTRHLRSCLSLVHYSTGTPRKDNSTPVLSVNDASHFNWTADMSMHDTKRALPRGNRQQSVSGL